MPRMVRTVLEGFPHHITQRGNYQQDTFKSPEDYIRYLIYLRKYVSKYGVSVLAYCLMPNHVHLVTIPESKFSLSKTFHACHTVYSKYFNEQNGLKGHLWQERFYSCILDEAHLYAAVRYIENNPVRAGLVKNAWEWKWSSAGIHSNKDVSNNILPLAKISDFMEIADWERYLMDDNEETAIKIRNNTLKGIPLVDDIFLTKLEMMFNRRLKPLPKGRPSKLVPGTIKIV